MKMNAFEDQCEAVYMNLWIGILKSHDLENMKTLIELETTIGKDFICQLLDSSEIIECLKLIENGFNLDLDLLKVFLERR
jgi:hypothetical protein